MYAREQGLSTLHVDPTILISYYTLICLPTLDKLTPNSYALTINILSLRLSAQVYYNMILKQRQHFILFGD